MGIDLSVGGVLGPDGALAGLPGWEPRPAQLDMAAAVESALARRQPLLVEAGTGTGKTLAYLVPAVLSGQKVVVSTGTKNLQEQILKKDIPLLTEHLPVAFTAVGLKGISNYLCLRRFREHVAERRAGNAIRKLTVIAGGSDEKPSAPPTPTQEDLFARKPAARSVAQAPERSIDRLGPIGIASANARATEVPVDEELEALLAFAERTETGDRAELPFLVDDSPLWRDVSSTTETRLGPRCPHFEDCFVTRARRKAQAADIVVVNHHLFFADLALKEQWPSAQLLPEYEAVIFDEAHQLEDVATDYFGLSVSSLRVLRLTRDLKLAVSQGHLPDRLDAVAAHLDRCAADLFDALRPRLPRDGRAPTTDETWRGEPVTRWHALDDTLAEVEGAAGSAQGDSLDAMERTASIARRARSLRDDLASVADRVDRRMVYWAETRGRTVFLNASPVDVADHIREKIVGRVEATVFTSATLTAQGSFDYVRSRLGLETASESRLDSPFDYARQALLYLPSDLPEPSSPDFAASAATRIGELLAASGGRAFLLFTSHRQMLAVHRLLAPRLSLPVLIQGERPKHLLLEDFRVRPSVLFATGSFWEGVDVAGDALQLVVIDKLPFAPPDDPLVAARVRRIEESGGDGFGAYQVPQAALALAQGFGRLIRHRRDRGVVAILDRRTSSRSYGKRVLSSLPKDCPRTADLDETCRFLRALRGPFAVPEAPPSSGASSRKER